MSDIMHPVPFGELLNRMIQELKLHGSIFQIPYASFYKDNGDSKLTMFGRHAATALGPAAGPHTQLAQNIITSYLTGGRFIELKTCQEKDDFAATGAVQKPCIDSTDEGYNVEWSTEFTLPKAWDEYAKAYIICLLLDQLMHGCKAKEPDFIFNMSVGYTLEGIKTEKMQKYIDSMLDARKDERWQEHLDELNELIEEGDLFEGTPWDGLDKKLKGFVGTIDPHIVNNVTISTMHGCPPAEIEAICSYMLKEKHIHTYVKLNPTLAGYDEARKILDANGFTYVTLTHENFEKDLQYKDAVLMLRRLVKLGKEVGREFGVKLTNTLGSVNDQGRLPGGEMYMSGRSLLPISTTVATWLSKEFEGKLPISYCGGVNYFTAPDLFACGLKPLTIATDMLHPGGYTKMAQIAKELEKNEGWKMDHVDVDKLSALSERARSGRWEPLMKSSRQKGSVKIGQNLPLTDCYVAPCQMACPIHQPIPEYVQLVGEKRYSDALALIYNTNPLPGITGWICDHQCQVHCTRNDYEGAVQIREMKKLAVQNGFAEFRKQWEGATEKSDVKAVVVGAGPAGLAAAYFLSRAGFDTTVLEKEKDAGGVVRHIIPGFRIPQSVIEQDIEFIKAHGVTFRFGVKNDEETVDALKKAGYDYIFYAIGAEKNNALKIEGAVPALEFLRQYKDEDLQVKTGRHVVVVGGGNTAMDTARAAVRVTGVEDVTVVYRRTADEMPAARDEYELAQADGIRFLFLTNPASLKDGTLTLTKMKLGEKDASGRRSPVATDETMEVPCDCLLAALGEKVETSVLQELGLPVTEKGWPVADGKTKKTPLEHVYAIGDGQSGTSVVVKCIASAQSAVDDAIDDVLGDEADSEEHMHHHCDDDDCGCEDHDHHHDDDDDDDDEEPLTSKEQEELTKEEDDYFQACFDKKTHMLATDYGDKDFAAREARRCMECSYFCNKCVDVCPNRANVAIDVRELGMFDNPFQIVHVDAYCNECGNCEIFCPYEGGPYKKKFTIFSGKEDFEKSTNSGFYRDEDGGVVIRQDGKVYHAEFDGDGNLGGDEGVSEETAALITVIFETYSYLLGPVED